ncbi:MAG: HD domain-containing phosphohydrolase, partial [Longimicrobiales bacterium]
VEAGAADAMTAGLPSPGGDGARAAEAERAAALVAPSTALADLLVGLLEFNDPYFRGGSSLTRIISVAIGRELGLDVAQVEALGLAAVLRDLGRLAMGGRLLSRGALERTDEVRKRIEDHVPLGLKLLEGVPLPPLVEAAIEHHHERWDGKGYPARLHGEQIPLLARVLAAADSFSAMIRPRQYRLPLRISDALDELRRESGRQFDPIVVRIALQLFSTHDLRYFGLGLRQHVLLVHPDIARSTIVAAKLCTSGFLAEVAPDLGTVGERLRRVPVEAIILSAAFPDDVYAPFLDGLRGDAGHATLPVVAIDADRPATRIALLSAGADICFGSDASFVEIRSTLAALVGQAARSRATGARASDDQTLLHALRGDLEDFGLTWLLQMLSYNSSTAALTVEGPADKGVIYVVDGEPHHAQTRGDTGEDALRRMMGWKTGHFAVYMERRPPQRTIHRPLMHLLLDQAVEQDETMFGTVKPR